jgi:hypothetical protein
MPMLGDPMAKVVTKDFAQLESLEKELLEIQHKNNLEIHEKHADLIIELSLKQSKLTIILAIIGAAMTILAALLGIWFGSYLSTSSSPKLSRSEQKMETTISETKLSKSQTAVALTNVSSPNPMPNQTTRHGVESK